MKTYTLHFKNPDYNVNMYLGGFNTMREAYEEIKNVQPRIITVYMAMMMENVALSGYYEIQEERYDKGMQN